MKNLLLIIALITFGSFVSTKEYKAELITGESIDLLFNEINTARANPKKYGRQIGINLRKYEVRPALVMDAYLMGKAQQKALEMAKFRRLSHYNLKGKASIHLLKYESVHESLSRTSNANDHIANLIIDSPTELGHRHQILGVDGAEIHDIVGIGLAKNESGEVYCCILTSVIL
jgi:uncharacterized protein YkwD